MNKYLETNIENYRKTLSECAQLRNDITNLNNRKENYYVTDIFYDYNINK